MARSRRLVGKRRGEESPSLLLTSMVDVMAILVIFLLMNYNDLQIQIKESEQLRLPESTSRLNPETAVSIVITTDNIYAEDKKLLSLDHYQVPASARQADDKYLIVPLYQELKEMSRKAKELVSKSQRDETFEGTAIIQGDRKIPFTLLRDVMYSAGQAEYSNFRFLVLRKEKITL